MKIRLCSFVPIAIGIVLLAGCAAFVRDHAEERMREGNYEQAIAEVKEGLNKYPGSTTLRAALISMRADAISRLLAEAARERTAGDLESADKTLQRALAIESGNERALAMRAELAVDRRITRVLQEANKQADAGNRVAALATVEAALRYAPRNPDLIAMQRRLETDIRGEGGAVRTLAEKRPITLDFRNAPLTSVLEAITRGSGVNFILDRDVRQDARVSVYLRSARVEDAIDLVTSAHQLARRIIDPQTVLIYPNTQEKQREHQEQVIRVFHLANAEAKTTAAFLKSMLRLKDVFVDERANLIALREPADVVAVAARLVALHDQPDAEVMLEVEVLEVSASRLTELGIRIPDSVTLTPLPVSGALTVQSLRDLNATQIGVGISPLVLNLRREVGDVNILANPRIRAKNKEKARILIGDKVPVITSTATATGFVSENVSYLDVGLKLEVESVVAPDDEVSIRLGLEVSNIAREVRSSSGTLAYQLGTRNANTVLRLHDGETQLLAGLISNEDRMAANRIPGLGDLPIAGRLFSSQLDDFKRTELVLAITPRVLRPAPRADVAQAEMWVNTELTTRLLSNPTYAIAKADPPQQATALLKPASPPAGAGGGAATTAPPAADGSPTSAANTEASPAPAAQPVTARLFWQSPAGARVGDTITVTLGIESANGLRAAPLEIAYTPATLEILEVVEGDFLKQGGASTSFTHAVNPSTGHINLGLLRNDTEGAQGRGALVQLRVKARRAGTGELRVASVRAIGQAAAVQSFELPTVTLQLR